MGSTAHAALPAATQQAIANGEVGRNYVFFGSGPNSRSKQWSNELQINYDSDFLTLTLGAVYFKGKDHNNEHGQQNTDQRKTGSKAGQHLARFHLAQHIDGSHQGHPQKHRETQHRYPSRWRRIHHAR